MPRVPRRHGGTVPIAGSLQFDQTGGTTALQHARPLRGSAARPPAWPARRSGLHSRLRRGAKVTDVAAWLAERGHEVSRGAVGRYARRWREQREQVVASRSPRPRRRPKRRAWGTAVWDPLWSWRSTVARLPLDVLTPCQRPRLPIARFLQFHKPGAGCCERLRGSRPGASAPTRARQRGGVLIPLDVHRAVLAPFYAAAPCARSRAWCTWWAPWRVQRPPVRVRCPVAFNEGRERSPRPHPHPPCKPPSIGKPALRAVHLVGARQVSVKRNFLLYSVVLLLIPSLDGQG